MFIVLVGPPGALIEGLVVDRDDETIRAEEHEGGDESSRPVDAPRDDERGRG